MRNASQLDYPRQLRESGDWVPTRVDTPGPKVCPNIASIKQRTTCGPETTKNSFPTDFCDGPSADFIRSRISRLGNFPHALANSRTGPDGQDHYSYVVLKDRPVIAHRTFLHGSAPAPLAPVTSVPRPARACLGSYDPAIVPEAPI